MLTNVEIDDDVLDEAVRLGGQQMPEETVHQALREYIQRRKLRDKEKPSEGDSTSI